MHTVEEIGDAIYYNFTASDFEASRKHALFCQNQAEMAEKRRRCDVDYRLQDYRSPAVLRLRHARREAAEEEDVRATA